MHQELSAFPTMQLISLVNSPLEGVEGLMCVRKFGWRVFAQVIEDEKNNICKHLSGACVTVAPYNSTNILCKGQITTGLYMVMKALIASKINTVVLVGYGMKISYHKLEFVNLLDSWGMLPQKDMTLVWIQILGASLSLNSTEM